MSDDTKIEKWERQEGETPVSFSAFMVYRGLGLTRSLAKAAEKCGLVKATKLERWSKKYSWVARAAAWDAHVDRESCLASVEEAREMAARHITFAKTMQAKLWNRLKDFNDADVNKMSHSEFRQWMMDATALERLSRGEPTIVQETRVNDQTQQVSAEEKLRVMRAAARALEREIGDTKLEVIDGGKQTK